MAGTADLQAWLQAAMLDGEASDAREHVLGDNRLTAEMRIGIYAQGYRLRLLGCLGTEYPVLSALAGPTAFGLFAQGYIAAHPSRSYTLYDFGAGFADYLDAARPTGDGTPQTVEAIPAALARVERARAEVHRARGVEGRTPVAAETGFDAVMASILGLGLGRAWSRPDSVRLLELPFDFTETLAAVDRGEPPCLPVATPSFMAVARIDYRVACHRLEGWQYDWLARLPVDAAIACPAPDDQHLAAWLPVAVTQGLVAPRA
ncbi:DNA-binding domain-containing protein [Sphingomonas sp. QA11]|uniref:HvfC/BufC N-terminal domain-containing protein n=1 Tax=Sphingomonas sp. QA11 TaxID=2950605 RepID=UPI00234A5780|nr:DNA-binding domain-containing protein [Sphingomonas sp. QA11]WCM27050.1 DNA-binding domain-containing protein [Sphingomonas sp. QA11]